jgi:small subunit ribosomal protein S5
MRPRSGIRILKYMEEQETIDKGNYANSGANGADAGGARPSVRPTPERRGRGPFRDRRGGGGGGVHVVDDAAIVIARARNEFAQKLIGIRRVARVMAGGRRFNFSVGIVLGDKKGRVGVGLGKAADTALAIEKATRACQAQHDHASLLPKIAALAQRRMQSTALRSSKSARLPGRGLGRRISVRTVLELAGVSDVTAKLLSRSKNPVNNARAAIEALKSIAK